MILLNSIGNHLRGHTFLPLPYLVWHLLPVIRRFPPNLHSYLATKCLCKWPVSEGFHCIGDLIIIHPGNKIQSNITVLECLTDSVSGKNVKVITNKAEYDIVKTLCDYMILKKMETLDSWVGTCWPTTDGPHACIFGMDFGTLCFSNILSWKVLKKGDK